MEGKQSKIRRFFKRLFKRKLVIFAAALVLLFIATAILAPILTPYDPYEQDLTQILKPPSSEHLLGTDEAGRDVLTRIFYGARTSLIIGVVSVMISAVIGVVLGLVSAYYGGIVNTVISRFIDVLMSLPSLMLALALGLVFGHSMTSLMIILGISTIPTYTRMMNGQEMCIRDRIWSVQGFCGYCLAFAPSVRYAGRCGNNKAFKNQRSCRSFRYLPYKRRMVQALLCSRT